MPLFLNIENLRNLLKETAEGHPRAEAMLESDSGRGLTSCILACFGQKKRLPKDAAFRAAVEGMGDYLAGYPAPPSYRHGLWKECRDWLSRIADALEITEGFDISEDLPCPLVEETGTALVKALHKSAGRDKEELSAELGVSMRTVQNGLRALDPGLQEGGKTVPAFRFAGQEMHVPVRCRRDEKSGKRWYSTPNRLHPVALQLNTMQAGNLLRALQEIDAGKGQLADNEVCRSIALDIWSQLSPQAKDRLKSVYSGRYPEFGRFMGELDYETENTLVRFRTEMEMEADLEIRQQLELAMKGSRRCSLRIRRDGKDIKLGPVIILWTDEPDSYLAVPADAYPDTDHAVRFWLDEVRGNLVFPDRNRK